MSVVETTIEIYRSAYFIKKDYPFEVTITDDIYSERLKLCHTKNDEDMVKTLADDLNTRSSLLVLPNETDITFRLLIHESQFAPPGIYSQTILYEYSRMIDYFELMEKHGIFNLRETKISEQQCFNFLADIRAEFHCNILLNNLMNLDQKDLVSNYLCQLVPEFETFLSHDLSQHMADLATFLGYYLAIKNDIHFELSLPDYLKRQPINKLLAILEDNIANDSIYDKIEAINEAYLDFVNNSSKNPQEYDHPYQCGHCH